MNTNLQTFAAATDSADSVDALGALLRELIDYAGLFPPASLSMAQSVANYDLYSRSQWHWVLGCFIVPVARLDDFKEAFGRLPPSTHEASDVHLRLSVLLGTDVSDAVARIPQFGDDMGNGSAGRKAVVDAVEVKVGSADEVLRLSAVIPSDLPTYFEVPLEHRDEYIQAIASCGRRAKIRTGGETVDKFPSAEEVIEFIRLCAAANVPFKATAGLHHPLRAVHRFTYQPESPSGTMHGFLNVFLAAVFLRAGMEPDLAAQLLNEQSAQAFQFDSKGIGWREHRLSRHEVAAARQNFAISFGSCSFTEPIDDLRSLRLL